MDPSWATINALSEYTRISTTSVADAGEYDFVLEAYLDNEIYPNGAND